MGMHVHRRQICRIKGGQDMHLRGIRNGDALIEDVTRHGEAGAKGGIEGVVRQIFAPAEKFRRTATFPALTDENQLSSGLHRLEAVDEALAALIKIDVLGVSAGADHHSIRLSGSSTPLNSSTRAQLLCQASIQ